LCQRRRRGAVLDRDARVPKNHVDPTNSRTTGVQGYTVALSPAKADLSSPIRVPLEGRA